MPDFRGKYIVEFRRDFYRYVVFKKPVYQIVDILFIPLVFDDDYIVDFICFTKPVYFIFVVYGYPIYGFFGFSRYAYYCDRLMEKN